MLKLFQNLCVIKESWEGILLNFLVKQFTLWKEMYFLQKKIFYFLKIKKYFIFLYVTVIVRARGYVSCAKNRLIFPWTNFGVRNQSLNHGKFFFCPTPGQKFLTAFFLQNSRLS